MRGRTVLVVVGLVLLGILVSLGMGFAGASAVAGDETAESYDRPSYPTDPEALPLWMADVSESPSGRAIALADNTNYVVYAADSNRVREVSAIAERTDAEYATVTMQLAPDGSRLAVGDASGYFNDVLIIDLVTGREQRFGLGSTASGVTEVLAWSPDGRSLAVGVDGLYVLNLESGRATKIADPSDAITKADLLPGEEPTDESVPTSDSVTGQAAFSPDGRSIAYDDGVDVEIYRVDGAGAPTLLTDRSVWLAGAAAWSPDGKRILVTRDETADVDGATSVLAIDVATRTATRVVTLKYEEFSQPQPIGWRAPAEVLLSGLDADSAVVVDAYGLDGTRGERVLEFGYSTISAQFASELIATATAQDAGFAGGPTPTGWRVAVGVGTGLVTALVCAVLGLAVGLPLLLRRRAATRRVSPLAAGYPIGAFPVPPFHVTPGGFAPPGGSAWPGGFAPPGGARSGPVAGLPPAPALAPAPAAWAVGGPQIVPQRTSSESMAGSPGGGMPPAGSAGTPEAGAPTAAADGADWPLPR
ncbi:hypothetical protein [Cryptosporangium minutisporangium]|uniref:WD40 repeat domain-containing protein n=1 Tax=Cryptosporangium minutisporangium TaxID=113569 RepID=A0ABP6SWX8_9ACTN